jgi:hypothetical protein
MITRGKMPISGGAGQPKPKTPVLTNQATTSAGAERVVRQSPQISGNRYGIASVPAGVHEGFSKAQRPYGSTSSNLKPRPWGAAQPHVDHSIHKGTSLSAAEMAAVGYTANATRGKNPIHSGHPTRGVTRTVGGGNQPSAKKR